MIEECTWYTCRQPIKPGSALCPMHDIKFGARTMKATPKKIAPKSKKKVAEDKIYNSLATQFKKNNPLCAAKLKGCQKETTDVHHKKGRGIWLLIVAYFLPVCRNCHRWIEEHPKESIELGFSASRLKI